MKLIIIIDVIATVLSQKNIMYYNIKLEFSCLSGNKVHAVTAYSVLNRINTYSNITITYYFI